MRKALLLLVLVQSYFVQSQIVRGVVSDSEGVLPRANIILDGELVALTDEFGYFEIHPSVGEHYLKVVVIGYEPESFDLQIEESSDIELSILLEEKKTFLDVVAVSASRYEQRTEESTISIDVLQPNLIADRVQSKVQTTLQQASSVNVADGQVNIRSGSGWSYGAGTRVLVLLDEMPIISPDAGQAQWSLIPTEAVSQMEILKGAASSLYGTSAMNGIVNVRTLNPTSEPHTDIRMYQGIYDAPKRSELKWWDGVRGWTGMQFNHTFSKGERKEHGFVIAGQVEHDGGYQYDVPDHRARLLAKYRYFDPDRPNWEYEIMTTGLWSETGDALLWNGYDEVYVPLDSQSTRTIGYDLIVDPKVVYRGASGAHTLRGRFMVINNNARSASTDYTNASRAGFVEYMWQKQFGRLMLVSGASNQYGRSNSEVFNGIHVVSNQAAYIQADYNLSWLILSGGLRYEGLRLDDRSWSRPVMRFGVNGGTKSTRFRATYGEGFRFPSMAEVYSLTNVGALKVYPNYGLEPESGFTTEVGIRQLFGFENIKGYVDIAAFYMRYQDMMEFSFGRWGSGEASPFEEFGFRSINVGDTEIRGIELSTYVQWDISETMNLVWMGGISWMDPKHLDPTAIYATYPALIPGAPDQELTYENTSSNPESGVLKYRYTRLFKSDVEFTWKSWSIGTSIRFNDYMKNIDQIFVDDIFSQFIPGIPEARENNLKGDWVFDARLRYAVNETVSVSFIVNNLTNLEYYPRPSLVGQSRSFAFQLRYQI